MPQSQGKDESDNYAQNNRSQHNKIPPVQKAPQVRLAELFMYQQLNSRESEQPSALIY